MKHLVLGWNMALHMQKFFNSYVTMKQWLCDIEILLS